MSSVARPYQPFAITGDGGFSCLNSPATATGSISCKNGSCWVRLLQTPTVTASGANAAILDPDTSPYTAGWAFLDDGATLTFGVERVHETAETSPVGQIDIWNMGGTVVCVQH